ncbi:ABC transporter permease [Mycolicibacterium litorale]|uniref:ABC transporter permease n=1 Tax=Mycolicibacterium litorale TaxID=758802 RepID=UPI003CE75208
MTQASVSAGLASTTRLVQPRVATSKPLAGLLGRPGVLPVGVLILVVGAWEAASQVFGIPRYIVPSPSLIWSTFWERPAEYAFHAWVTGYEALLGLLAALVIGVLLALLLAQWRLLDRIMMPYLVLMQVTPTVAIAPMLTIWFGYDAMPKVVTAFLTSFFPIVIMTTVGLRSADRDVLDLFHVIAAPRNFVFWRVKIWFALPQFLGALKVAVPAAVVGAIIGEFISSTQGLGYVIMTAQASLNTGVLFVAILCSSLLGIAAFAVTSAVTRKLLYWHESQMDPH